MTNRNLDAMSTRLTLQDRAGTSVHPTWLRLIRYCADLGHGEIEKLKIQDGVPVLAETVSKKVKFGS
jgi:hypothetical protein